MTWCSAAYLGLIWTREAKELIPKYFQLLLVAETKRPIVLAALSMRVEFG